ncbi:MAG: TIGR00296 family protein [Nitrososphaerales archaeon]|nr:TIGR00296 family protein [Nitrososphaerales archaeon]
MTTEEGKTVVGVARASIEEFVRTGKTKRTAWRTGTLSEKRGVFVTLNLAAQLGETLRGCIGYPLPVKPLGEAVEEVAVLAASQDPRFPPVRKEELDGIIVEVSVLTQPETLKVRKRTDLPSRVRVGTDGLIVSKAYTSGLLLPQVPVEYSWGPEEFLSQTCMKAGLTPDAWLDEDTEVQRFQAEIFAEESPGGRVVRRPL